MATNARSDEEILSTLEKYAYLVRGCWIIKSGIAKRNPSKVNVLRDYMLLLLHKNGFIKRKEFTDICKLDRECVT